MYNKKSTQIVPKSVMAKIVKVFPNAIVHNYQPPSDECIGNCRECQLEKDSAERFPHQVKEWKAKIDDSPLLLGLVREEYHPVVGDGSGFSLLHTSQVQGWRDAYKYLSRTKKNVANETVRKKLLELCPASSSLLICEEHKKTVIPNLSEENEQGAISLKDRGLELVTEEHCTALLKSINTLRDIIFQDKEHSSDAIGGMEHPVALVDQDHTLIHIEPERCDKGCVCLACDKEPERENEQNEVQVLDCAEEESEPQK